MLQFCQLNYGVTFPIAKKVRRAQILSSMFHRTFDAARYIGRCVDGQADVNGPETQPIWKYLKSHAEPPVEDIDWVSTPHRLKWRERSLISVELFEILGQGWKDYLVPRPKHQSCESIPACPTKRRWLMRCLERCGGCLVIVIRNQRGTRALEAAVEGGRRMHHANSLDDGFVWTDPSCGQ